MGTAVSSLLGSEEATLQAVFRQVEAVIGVKTLSAAVERAKAAGHVSVCITMDIEFKSDSMLTSSSWAVPLRGCTVAAEALARMCCTC